ncbi:MAG: M48 family metallopeptidase [Myxococcota bacterium]|nr:M48 family metallopeptidase [Myxococcota bacterium]
MIVAPLLLLGCLLLPADPAAAETSTVEPGAIERRAIEQMAIEHEAMRLRSAGLELWLERSRRLLRVSEALRLAGAPLCKGKVSPVLGVVAASRDDLPWPLHRAAERDYHVDEGVRVLHVEPGLAAAEGGLEPGDLVVSIAGRQVRSGAALASVHAGRIEGHVRLEVERRGEPQSLEIPARLGCFAAAAIQMEDGVNAYMGRGRTFATSGLMRFVANDDELAVIMGHEIAHHVLGTGSVDDFEADADQLGLYMAAAAGFDVSVASGFWKRWTLRSPLMIHERRRSSHPPSHARALRLEAVLAEIERKRAAGLPLEPERVR